MSYLFSKTLSPELYDLNVYYEKDFYTLYSNYGEFLQEGIDTLDYFLEYNKSNVIFDPINNKVDIFNASEERLKVTLFGSIRFASRQLSPLLVFPGKF